MRKSLLFLVFLLLFHSSQREFSFFLIDPLHCVTAQRFDVLAKYIYAKHYHHKVNSAWASNLYIRHLEAWNPSLKETDGVTVFKDGVEDYLEYFHNILLSVSNGFNSRISVVPLCLPTYNLLDGAHRTAAALVCKKYLTCDVSYLKPEFNVTSSYFKSVGLEEKYLDAMALEYTLLKKNTYFVNVFPVAQGHESEIENILSRNGNIVYRKNIFLKGSGPFLFMKSLYEGQEWIGSEEDGYKGAADKAAVCFPPSLADKPVRIYLFESNSFKDVLVAKAAIRNLFKMEHSSVHVNDTHKEARQEARIVFNNNSIHCLNNRPSKDFPQFAKFMIEYKRWLKKHCLDEEDFCIDGSSVLAAYGVREAADLDFLYHGDPLTLPDCHECFDEHSAQLKYYCTTKDDIIFNPENHFYYKDVKFASIDIIRNMKKVRAEDPKDNVDLKLIALHFKQ